MKYILFYEDKHNYGKLAYLVAESKEEAMTFINDEETIPEGEASRWVLVFGDFDLENGVVDKT